MADDTLRLGIEADASGVSAGVREAEQALGRLGDSVDREGKNLNLYGERLGKVFGKGEGLHGRLDALEMPLRDVEGGFDRARQTAFVFGNTAESASEKATQGFLLAADAIAAFTSGGVAGIAITAAVAGFALLSKSMQDEAAAAEEAKKAEEEHTKALEDLGKAAVDAGVSIAALQAKEAAGIALARVRAVEQGRIEARLRQRRFKDELEDLREQERNAMSQLEIGIAQRKLKEKAAQIEAQDELVKGYERRLHFAKISAKEAQSFYLNDLKLSSESAVTSFVEATKGTTTKAAEAMRTISENANKQQTTIAKKQAEQQRQQSSVDIDFEAAVRAAKIQDEEDAAIAMLGITQETQNKRVRIIELANTKEQKQAQATAQFMAKLSEERTQMAMAAATTVTGALFEQAKAGELSASKLLEAVLASTGQELVARGTLHAFQGIATANPVMAGTGAAMIASGLAMGAASGAVSRAGQPAARSSSASSTPTDTRQSRAASTAGSSEGGTTVINFNGPAYDRRGVANVLNAGQKMARHRRVMGA